MQGENSFNGSVYLDGHLESDDPRTDEELHAHEKPLSSYPAGVENYLSLPESGEVTLDDFRYRFRLEEINPSEFFLDQKFDINEMMDASPEGPTDEQVQKFMYRFLLGEYDPSAVDRAKIVAEYAITNQESGQTIDIAGMLPEGYRIVLRPTEENKIVADEKGKFLFIDGNLLSTKTTVDLLHEIGHVVILSSLEQQELTDLIEAHNKHKEVLIEGGEVSDETLATHLKNERDAWAFALKVIKRILDGVDSTGKTPAVLNQVDDYIHENILKQNSDGIRKMRGQNFKGMFQESLEKYRDQKNQ